MITGEVKIKTEGHPEYPFLTIGKTTESIYLHVNEELCVCLIGKEGRVAGEIGVAFNNKSERVLPKGCQVILTQE